MRKRSDTGSVQQQSASKAEDMFPPQSVKAEARPRKPMDATKSPLPSRVSFQDGMYFIQCPIDSCRLIQSWDTLDYNLVIDDFGDERATFHCFRCQKNLDPDCQISEWEKNKRGGDEKELLKKAEELIAAQKAYNDAERAAIVEEEPIAKKETLIQPQKCITCGKELTKTNVGIFWPCGHTPGFDKVETDSLEYAKAMEEDATELRVAQNTPPTRFTNRVNDNGEPAVRSTVKKSQSRIEATANESRTVSVTCPEMVFTPRQYCTFRIGPYTATQNVPEGGSVAEITRDLLAELRLIQAEEFKVVLKQYKVMVDEMVALYGRH